MYNILKQLREEANLTQETVADQLGVSVNTVQNWERTGKITKESLHDLLDIYEIDHLTRNRVVLSVFGDNRTFENIDTTNNFPEFLFNDRPDVLSFARGAVLTADEMDLFGYLYYVDNRCPYEPSIFKYYGGYFHARRLFADIWERIGAISKKSNSYFASFVYNYGMSHPGTSFNFVTQDKETILKYIKYIPCLEDSKIDIEGLYEKCKAVVDPVLLGTTTEIFVHCKDMPELIRNMVDAHSNYKSAPSYYTKLDKISSQCIIIEEKEKSDDEYIKRREQYLSDRKAYDEHPDLYDRAPSFKYEYEYWLKLTEIGEQYIKWMES